MKKLPTLFLILMVSLCVFAGGSAENPKKAMDLTGLKIASPSGAPAIGLASLAVENPDQYTFVAAETITAEFANGTSDFIVAPINAGAKLFSMGKSSYKLGAVISWGNLFFASQRPNFKLEDMDGADITLFGENTINASLALYSLSKNGIEPKSVSYLASAANTQQLLLTNPEAIVLTAEPALTAAKTKKPEIQGYSLNSLYEMASGNNGFPQAGIFIKEELIINSPEMVDAYLKAVKESCDRCSSDLESVANAVVSLELLPSVGIGLKSIPNCAVRYVSAQEAREEIEQTALIDIKQFGGVLPSLDFYYETK